MPYVLALVGLVSFVIIGIGIRQKKQSDIILGALIIILCLLFYIL